MKTKRSRACGKTRFRDDLEAKSALRKIKATTSEQEVTPVRWYWCKACRGTHLTSQAARGSKR